MADSNIKKDITAPIDDYLLSIADSLQRVQQQLNYSKVLSEDGKSYTTYQLPKLEFELKMTIEMGTVQEDGTQRSVMKAVPVNQSSSSKKSQSITEASTIKGIFVAVPSDLGKPPPIIRTFLRSALEGPPKEYEITVIAQSAVGGYLDGVEVQFNIDRDMSGNLSKNTYIKDGVRYTDENGQASTRLVIDKKDSPGATIAILVDALGKTETIFFEE